MTAGSTLVLTKAPQVPLGDEVPLFQVVTQLADTPVGTNTITLNPNSTLSLVGVQISNTIDAPSDPTIMVTGANSTGALTGAGDYNIVGTSGSATTDVLTLTAASTNSGQTIVGDGTAGHVVTLTASGSFLSGGFATGVTNSACSTSAASTRR